jgi:K+-sensing histidine kinase KdpD
MESKVTKSPIWHYGVALFSVALALVSTLLLRHVFPYPFLFLFFAAVLASAWLGGTAQGLFAVLLSTLAVDYFFIRPLHSSQSALPRARILPGLFFAP